MNTKISLEIKDLGLIHKADLEINNINVIVGKNSTGKSTSSKLLFCLMTAYSWEGNNLANNDIKFKILDIIEYLHMRQQDELSELMKISQMLLRLEDMDSIDDVLIRMNNLIEELNSDNLKRVCFEKMDKVKEIVEKNKNKSFKYLKTLNLLLNSEYAHSLDKHKNLNLIFKSITNNKEMSSEIFINGDVKEDIDLSVFSDIIFENIIYIDSPSILEYGRIQFFSNRREVDIPFHLRLLDRKLRNTNNDAVYDEEYYRKLLDFKKKIDQLIGGNFIYDEINEKFIFKSEDETYQMENTSSGLKQLGIFQILLDNKELTENSFLILDNPEINLHPEFQVKFAEILVLAVKELNITLYIIVYYLMNVSFK